VTPWADDQNFVGAHALQVFNAAGAVVGTFTFTDAVAHGVNQDKILIATPDAVSLFGGLTTTHASSGGRAAPSA
jgi:hypothetical protein